jgi:probable HAF family extracellular repeat protein
MTVYSYTTFDDPAATQQAGGTGAWGVNDSGQIVGLYVNAAGEHGYLMSGGAFSTLDDPLAAGVTDAYGINNTGQIVGYYHNASGGHGFLFNPNGGTWMTLDDPSAVGDTAAIGISATGQIVGDYVGSNGKFHGFIYSNGTYAPFDILELPYVTSTVVRGINSAGLMVGYS